MPGEVVDRSVAGSRGFVRMAASTGCCRAPAAVGWVGKPEGGVGEVGGRYDKCLMSFPYVVSCQERFLSVPPE